MQLADLTIIQNVTPKWGAGHYLAHDGDGNLLEVLVAERSTESVTATFILGQSARKGFTPLDSQDPDNGSSRDHICCTKNC